MRADTVIIFDLDGTLVDAFADILHAVNVPLKRRGLPVHPLENIRSMVGSGIAQLCCRAAPMLTGPDQEEYLADVRATYAAHPVVHARPYEGVIAMLEALRSVAPTAVLSNKPHEATIEVCNRLGITQRTDLIQGEDAPRVPRKPDPIGARAILGRLAADRAIVVGDMAPDGMLARAMGMPFIGVLWSGATADELHPFDPVALCGQPRDVTPQVRRLLTESSTSPEFPLP